MVFVKTVKTKAYFKRYQVKYRRRREGKTDYAARTALVKQEKSKYNSNKYRFVVRFTNKRVIAQVIFSTIVGDHVLCAADSTELKRFGVPVGLKNYSAAYATGLLLARRLLKQVNLDATYKGAEKLTGEAYHVEEEEDEERRPFKALLDVGLVRTTTGHRVFAALKGAVDGGLHIPHSEKRFHGFSGELKAESLKARVLGEHVAEYMASLKSESPDSFERQFSSYIKNKVTAESLTSLYEKAHSAIRANPERPAKKARAHKPVHVRDGQNIKTSKATYPRARRLSCQQRKDRVAQKLALAREMLAGQE